MDLNGVLKEKKAKNTQLKTRFSLPTKKPALGLIKLSNKSLIKDLRDGLLILPACFIIEVDGVNVDKLGDNVIATGKLTEDELIGFDFIVGVDDIKNLNKYLKKGITPIVSTNNTLNSILKEFNPIKNEGNAYLFSNDDKWSVFYAITRYLENFKFPFDNKNLVKNVLDI